MIPETQIILRVFLAAALGAIIGYERERQNQVAGLRTHIVLAVGASLAMMLSIYVAAQYHGQTENADPARIAAQVVSGIGFLGAGAILRYGTTVKGLTTATSLWTVAIIGMAVGAGLYLSASFVTIILLIVLALIGLIEDRLIQAYTSWTVVFQADDRQDLFENFRQTVSKVDHKMDSTSFKKNIADNLMTIEAVIKTVENKNMESLTQNLAAIPGARHVEVNVRLTT